MAELLVKAVDAVHLNPTKSARGCFKRGDIVRIEENGYEWGALEVLPPVSGGKFVIIKITDVTKAQVINWCQNNWVLHPMAARAGASPARRACHIDINLVPAGVLITLNTTGEYSNTWANIRQYVRNKITNATATGASV